MTQPVSFTVAAGIGTIRLDRPPMNALNAALQEQIAAAATQAAASDEVSAVIITGGEKVFAAGADIKEMADMDTAAMMVRAGRLSACFDAVAQIPKPVIAAISGYALGGGCELALAADFRVAAQDATLGQPEILLGIIPGAGGTQRLARLVGPAKAKDMIFSGRFVAASECLTIGLVDALAPAGEVYSAAVSLAQRYVGGPALALRAAKQAVDLGLSMDLASGLKLESSLFASLFGTADRRIGMTSFIENGPGKARFTGQ